MRPEIQHHSLLPSAKDPRVSQRRHARANLDRPTSCIIKTTPFVEPAIHIPRPARNRAVDNRGPTKYEDHHGDEAAALGNRTDYDGGCDSAELHLDCISEAGMIAWRDLNYLIKGIQQIRNQWTARTRRPQRLHEAELLQVAYETVGCVLAERQRVSPEVPLKRDDGERAHAGPDKGQGRFSSCQTGIEEAQTRHHDQHHGRGDDDVGLVAGLVPLIQILRP